MCDFIVISTALALAQTAYQTYEQDQTVKAQNKINEKSAKEGAALANQNFIDQSKQVALRNQQEQEGANRDILENAKGAARARATARTSAGEAGVAGVSVNSLINDYYRQEGGYNESVNRNAEFSRDQSQSELLSLRSGAIDRGLAGVRPVIERPSWLAAGVTAGSQAAGLYSQYRYNKVQEKKYKG